MINPTLFFSGDFAYNMDYVSLKSCITVLIWFPCYMCTETNSHLEKKKTKEPLLITYFNLR